MMSRKKTVEDCINLAESKGGKFLSEEYKNNHTKYLWECNKGHKWLTTYADVQQGYWCPDCGGTKKKTLQDCRDLAAKMGGKFLSEKYVNAHEKYLWKCGDCENEWLMKYSDVYNNHWCPECAKINRANKKRHTIQDCHDLAASRGGKFLSKEYTLNNKKYKWQCGDCGNIWMAQFASIKDSNSWCPECAKIKRKETNIEKYGFACPLQNEEVALKHARSQNNSFILTHWKTGEEVVCIASYEKAAVEYFNKNKIDFHWQPKVFKMPNGKTYRPDCYLPDRDLWVEIKGHKREKNMVKWQWFQSEHPNSELWDKQKLRSLKIL
jgi:predicted RNA-binding Zn-ribbon protein involved in translation (DUF1610 family)